MILLDCLFNVALLLALGVVSGWIEKHWSRRSPSGVLLQGILFGGLAVPGMLRPMELGPGLALDSRSIMVGLCALFFGPSAAVAAMVIAVTCGIGLGGEGMLTGFLVILSSGGMGLMVRFRVKPEEEPLSARSLYLFGLAVHLVMLALMLLLPEADSVTVAKRVGPTLLLLYPLATVLAGKILSEQLETGRTLDVPYGKEGHERPLNIVNEAVRETQDRRATDRSVALMSFAMRHVREAAFLIDEHARFHYVNEESCRVLGYTNAELLDLCLAEVDPDFALERWPDHWAKLRLERSLLFEGRHKAKDGRIFPVEINANYFEYDGTGYNLALVREIRERKQAEHERWTNFKFLESMDRINRAIQQAEAPDGMMGEVLDVIVEIFDCDRVWLAYPCDPLATTFRVLMERSRPEYTGTSGVGQDVPVVPEIAHLMRTLLASDGPVRFGPGSEEPLPQSMAKHFHIQSQMVMAIHPATDVAYAFGMHQCSHPRIWTPEEVRLFQEVGRRMADRLTSLLAYRNLEESRARLLEAQRIAKIGNWEWDVTQNRLWWSDEASRIFDIQPEAFGATLEAFIDAVHPEDRGRVESSVRQALDGDSGGWQIDYRITRADGTIRFLHEEGETVFDADGKPLKRRGTVQDITERKNIEEALRRSEAKYMDLYENAPDMYVSVDGETGLIDGCNRRLADTLGCSKDEIVGQPVFVIYHPDCVEEAKETFEWFRETGEIHDKELQLRRDGGSKLDVSVNVSSVRGEEGEILHRRSTLRDITERRRDQAIKEARLHLLQFSAEHSLDQLLEETLNEAEALTGSRIGFYHFVEEDQESLTLQNWSARTKAEFCRAEGKGLHYAIAEAGVWVDCVHERRPIIHNDYASLSRRKGTPEGHPEVIRELVVPVFRGESIRAILGVGNKPEDYTERDVEAVSLLADLAWEIAERKQAEEALQRSNEMLRAIIESAPTAIIGLDLEGNVRSVWNPAAERMLGWKAEEVMGRPLPSVPADREEEFSQFRDRIRSGRTLNGIDVHRQKRDGSPIDYSIYASPMYDEQSRIVGKIAVLLDITERKRAELDLRESEERYRAIVAGFDGLIYICSKDYRVEFMNEKFIERTGHDPKGMLCYKALHERDAVCPWCVNERVFKGETVRWEVKSPKDGRWYYVVDTPICHADGSLSKQAMILDITERKAVEEELHKLTEQLEKRIVERTAELEATNKELEAFAYSVSHDLRAPLRHIDGFLKLLGQRMQPALNGQSRHYMETISESARRMGSLIDDLLSFSRTGRHEVSKERVHLGELIREVIQQLEDETRDRRIQWTVGDLPTVSGDRTMLGIVFVNLISNALKFTRPRHPAEIEIGRMPGEGTEEVIFVRDNGIGFDMKYVDKLFGVFQRLHRTDEFEGTGIGLANVRRIIARHGGRTWATGERDRGATFYVSLPRA